MPMRDTELADSFNFVGRNDFLSSKRKMLGIQPDYAIGIYERERVSKYT
jgi:hypothetical protein